MTTVVVQIGNSDNKLSQAEWAEFIAVTREAVKQNAAQIHFEGFSNPTAEWQNACWVFERNTRISRRMWEQFSHVAGLYKQDSIAVTVGGTTRFVTP